MSPETPVTMSNIHALFLELLVPISTDLEDVKKSSISIRLHNMLPLGEKVVTLEKGHTEVKNRLLKAEQKCKSLEEKLISLETSSRRNNLKLLNVKDTDSANNESQDCEQMFYRLV